MRLRYSLCLESLYSLSNICNQSWYDNNIPCKLSIRLMETKQYIRRSQFYRKNHRSNFLRHRLINRQNVRRPIKIRRDRQAKHPRLWFFIKDRTIYFPIDSIRAMSFPGAEIKATYSYSICLKGQQRNYKQSRLLLLLSLLTFSL